MSSSLPRLDPDQLPEVVDVSDNSAELDRVKAIAQAGPFVPTWESLQTYTIPRWYVDAKFGIFLHWGVYSVPAFGNEWYARNMYREGTKEFDHHVATYGPQKDFGYKDFIPSFTMAEFDPVDWSALFKRSGAQFVVPVAEHHDGFTMYASDRSRWTAATMGPQRDVFGDLITAVDADWMVGGASSHRAEHWFFMNGGARFDSDVRDPAYQDFYGPAQREELSPNERHLEDWLLRTVEIIDKYRPQVLWFDWWIETPVFEPYLRLLAAYYYNRAAQWGREVVINFKWNSFAKGSAVYDIERGALGGIRDEPWQNDTSVSRNSWSWIEGHDYKSVDALIAELADTVSKNGVLLLNIGPKPDGTIADEERAMLEQIGDWLTVNGEAIYGTRPWLTPGEGPTVQPEGSFADANLQGYTPEDLRFTSRTSVAGEHVYAIALAAPTDGVVTIGSWGANSRLLNGEIARLTVLGSSDEVTWSREPDHLRVELPDGSWSGPGGPAIRIDLEPAAVSRRHDFHHG